MRGFSVLATGQWLPLHNCLFQKLTGAELRLDGSLDLDLFARLRVPAFASRTLLHAERAESCDRDLLTVAHGFYDRVKNGFHRALCSCFRIDLGRLHDRLDQSLFVHNMRSL